MQNIVVGIPAAAAAIGVQEHHLDYLARSRLLPGTVVFGRRVFNASDLERLKTLLTERIERQASEHRGPGRPTTARPVCPMAVDAGG